MKSPISRRRFLEGSILSAAALAAASGGRRLFAEDQPEANASANDRLSVATVGVRGRGTSHLGAFGTGKETEVTYICDADEAIGQTRAEEVAKSQGRKPKYVKDMREVFDDKNVDIVTTATPNHWHALCSIWAMQAGKDVYVEKPVSHNVWEGRQIVEISKQTGKICQTGTQCRSNPGIRDAMAFMHAGNLGEIKLARGLCYKRRDTIGPRGTYEPPASVDFDLWSGPAPILPLTRSQFHYDWHWQWPYGNGDLGNQGIHQMDLARWGLGVNDIGTSVVSYGGRFGYEDAGDTANTQTCIHGYPNDKFLVFEVRGLNTDKYMGAGVGNIFQGTNGYMVIDSYNHATAFDPRGTAIKEFNGGDDSMHFANFLKAVRSRKREVLNADILDGHLSSALCHLGNISYRLGAQQTLADAKSFLAGMPSTADAVATLERFAEHLQKNGLDVGTLPLTIGRYLAIDPATETFTGEDISQASSLLTREYRAPFIVPKA